MNFKTFRHKETGVEAQYPAHYATHPVYKDILELVDTDSDTNEEFEEDKVVVDDSHELPVEQRTAKRSRRKATTTDADDSTDKSKD